MSEAEPSAAAIELARQVVSMQPFAAWAGLEVLSFGDGACEIAMTMRPEFAQQHGYLHGGLVGFLADNACGFAAASKVGDVVTSQYDLRLLSPGVGERFTARGEVVKVQRRVVTVRGEVHAWRGDRPKLIAIATASVTPLAE